MKINPKTLSQVAPTLADLKKLPMQQKCYLLLARLAKIGEHDSALNKHNLMMPGDPYALASGYPDAEKTPVREHLMGAPWTRLVTEGYLVDFTGQGFFKVTEDGKEYLDQEYMLLQVSPIGAKTLKSRTGTLRTFFSYSWDGEEHQQWVTRLAERLQGEGVEIIFDRWHLNPGNDKLHFMEEAVAKSDFVVVICTPTYSARANNRQGGVGYESMVITAELADHILTNKFIPVLRKGTWETSLPIYLKTRFGVNLSDEPYREDEYEKLLRVLHAEFIQPPPPGNKPDFSKRPAPSSKAGSLPGPQDKAPAAVDAGGPGSSNPLIGNPLLVDRDEQMAFLDLEGGDRYYRVIEMSPNPRGYEKDTNTLYQALKKSVIWHSQHPWPLSVGTFEFLLKPNQDQTRDKFVKRGSHPNGISYSLKMDDRFEYVEARRDCSVMIIENEGNFIDGQLMVDEEISTISDALRFWTEFYTNLSMAGNYADFRITWYGLTNVRLAVRNKRFSEMVPNLLASSPVCNHSSPVDCELRMYRPHDARGWHFDSLKRVSDQLFSQFNFFDPSAEMMHAVLQQYDSDLERDDPTA